MAVRVLEVRNYRSLRHVRAELGPCTVVVGPNGSGKTNLYRALWLLTSASRGQLASELVAEGGVPSIVWAGPRRKGPVRVELSVELDDFSYALAFGPMGPGSPFTLDPEVKEEELTVKDGGRALRLAQRDHGAAFVRDQEGNRVTIPAHGWSSESLLSHLQDPTRFPVLGAVQLELSRWRFYHAFRTDVDAPVRRAHPLTLTPVLADDGSDLGAALLTIETIGDGAALREHVEQALGGHLHLDVDGDGRVSLALEVTGIPRPMRAHELSDGSLRFLCLAAALLSPRPAPLLVLNEPETSLHGDLLPALARLIHAASRSTQVFLTTHARGLAEELARLTGEPSLVLEKVQGETRLTHPGAD